MQEYLIKEYIKNLKVEDIINYANKNKYNISLDDALILLTYAKKYYHEFLSGYPKELLHEIKSKINYETYKIAYKLYIECKIKYLS